MIWNEAVVTWHLSGTIQ